MMSKLLGGTVKGLTIVLSLAFLPVEPIWADHDPVETMHHWSNPIGGAFSTSGSWLEGSVPAESDVAVFDIDGPYAVTFDRSWVNDRLLVRDGFVKLHLNGQTYDLVNPEQASLLSTASPSFIVGDLDDENASLTLTGGSLNSVQTRIGNQAGSAGNVAVTGSMMNWTNSETFSIGLAGKGQLTIDGGAIVTNWAAYIGRAATAEGKVYVNGRDTVWESTGMLRVGAEGKGEMAVKHGGTVITTLSWIGSGSGSTGTVTVSGEDSRFTNRTGETRIGNYGNGRMLIEHGGVVTTASSGSVGFGSSGDGTVTVTGEGSVWTNGTYLSIGGSVRNPGGTGLLTVADGAQVHANNDVMIWGNGILRGDATLVTGGTFTNMGLVSPGLHGDLDQGSVSSTGTLTLDGGYTQGSSGSLGIRIDGNGQYDQLHVLGDASLAGIVEVRLVDDFSPLYGDVFDIVIAEEIEHGDVDWLLPELDGSLMLEVQRAIVDEQERALRLTVVPEPASLLMFSSAVWLLVRRQPKSRLGW